MNIKKKRCIKKLGAAARVGLATVLFYATF